MDQEKLFEIGEWFDEIVCEVADETFGDGLFCNAHPDYNGWSEVLEWAGVKFSLPVPEGVFTDVKFSVKHADPHALPEMGVCVQEGNFLVLKGSSSFKCEVEDEGGSISRNEGLLEVSARIELSMSDEELLRLLKLDDASIEEQEKAAEETQLKTCRENLREALRSCFRRGFGEQEILTIWHEVEVAQVQTA